MTQFYNLKSYLTNQKNVWQTLLIVLLILPISLFSQHLVKWDFEGLGGQTSVSAYSVASGVKTQAPSTVASLGEGFLPRNYLQNGLTASWQNQLTLADAITDGDYISFTISPQAGKAIDITNIVIRPVTEGPQRYFALLSSIGGFAENKVLSSVYAGKPFRSPLYDLPVSGHSNITEAVEFRVYIYGEYGNIYQGIGFGNDTGDDLIIEGVVRDDAGGVVDFDPNTLPEVQLGLGGVSYYGAPLFANALYLENRNWRDKSTNQTLSHSSDQINENGYPQYLESGQILYAQPGQNNSDNKLLFKGRVVLTWEGEADIRLTKTTQVSGSSTGMVVNGRREYQYDNPPNGYVVEIHGINPSNPPSNIRVWMPDPASPMTKSLEPQAGDPEPLFHPTYLSLIDVSPFSVYRFMDWGHTNANPLVNWNERRPKDHCFQSGYINERNSPGFNPAWGDKKQSAGVSYEMMIELCNLTNKDMWICVPHGATDDFVKKLGKLIMGKDPDGTGSPGLNSNLKVYLEYSNEIWAPYSNTFCQGQYADEMAKVEGISREHWIAHRFAQVWSMFQAEMGGNSRLVRVLATWTGQIGYTSKLVSEVVAYAPTLNPPVQADVLAVTTYFGNGIQEYVFNEIDYVNPTAAEYDKVFKEWENRLLSSEASTTGQDFTGGGGGVPGGIVDIANNNNMALVAYEGGTGLPFGNFVYAKDCKIVPKETAGATRAEIACHAGSCSGGDCNNSPYHEFIYALHRDQRIEDMFYIHHCLAKAKGVRMVTQFGDFSGMTKWGFWGFAETPAQPVVEMHKYNFWMDWQPEQQDISEIQNPKGKAPTIYTQGELYPAKVGYAANIPINYGGGDGTHTAEIIGSGFLPAGLSFSYQSNKVVISGTPAEAGIYRFALRVLDADKDPAYSVFTLTVLPAPEDAIFAEDDFGTNDGALNDSENGYGFSAPWDVQSDDPNFALQTSNPLTYSGLLTSGGAHATAGSAYRSAGRNLDVEKFGYLQSSTNKGFIGQTNAALWMSVLVNRVSGCQKSDVIFLMDGNCAFCNNDRIIKITVLANGNWGLIVRNLDNSWNEIDAGISAVAMEGEDVLLVLGVHFDQSSDLIQLYINPSDLGGNAPSNPAISYQTSGDLDMMIKKVGIYGSKNTFEVAYDDLRLGDTYKAVTPVEEESRGTITRQYWTGISGTSVANLTGNSNYPNNPTGVDELTSLEAVGWASSSKPGDYMNFADNYGQRIMGYIHPPATGNYTFYVSSDDKSEVWLSSSSNPSEKVKICYESSWTRARIWETGAEKSTAIALQAGQKYYIEVLHKEGGGGDNCAVAWTGPGISAITIIDGEYLSPFIVQKAGDREKEALNISSLTENILVYPNPTTGMVTINLNGIDKADLQVVNMQGQLIQLMEQQSGIVSFDLSGYSSGLYFIKVKDTQYTTSIKLLVQ